MKKVFLTIICLLGFITINAQTNFWENSDGEIIETTKPILLFEEEVHDFGEQIEGPKYDYTFTFKNIGAEPLIIKTVKASCGCTTPQWPKEPVMPGEESEIKVIYNSKNRIGNFNKAITITSNAVEPTKRIYIKGKIKKGEEPQEVKPVMEEQSEE